MNCWTAELQFKDNLVISRTDADTRMIAIMQVMSNHNRVTGRTAKRIVVAAKKAADKYKVPVNVVLAIAFVESGYRVNAVNNSSNDYGIMQVNAWHVRKSRLSVEKLLTDIDYSFEHGVRIFQWFYKTYPLDEAIRRYNCGTKYNCINYKKVKKYLEKVKKSM